METTQGVIGLTIKERSKNKNTIVKYDPKSVQAWLNNLPMANIGEVSRAVFQALTEFNQTEVGCGERYKCLLQFEKVVEFVRVALKKHYLGHSVALTEKQRKIASLAQALDNEMAIGYKTVVEDAAAKNILLKDKKLITTALYHAMDYLSKILLRCYQLYSTAPKKIWQETHLLFAYAIDQNYQGSLVAVEDGKKKRSIESLYLKIILLTLANPYQLRQKDIDLIYSSLNDLISMISLEESTEFDDEYIIDLT